MLEDFDRVQREVLAHFRREALAASVLQHPGISPVYKADVVSHPPGCEA